jgi:hypothetical protein
MLYSSSVRVFHPFSPPLPTLRYASSSGAVVQKVVEYLAHKTQFLNAKPNEDIPEFEVPLEIALEL